MYECPGELAQKCEYISGKQYKMTSGLNNCDRGKYRKAMVTCMG